MYLNWEKLAILADEWPFYLNSLSSLFEELRKGENVCLKPPERMIKWSVIEAGYKALQDDAPAEDRMTLEELAPIAAFMWKFAVEILLDDMVEPPKVLVEIDQAADHNPCLGGRLVQITDPSGQSEHKLSFYVYDVDGQGQMSLLPADLIEKDC